MTPRHLVLAALLLPGCGLFGAEDTMIEATGRVVSAETGEPIVGLGISLCEVGTLVCFIVDTDQTDAEGAFAVVYDP